MGKAQTLRTALIHTGDALVSACLAPRCACCTATLASPRLGPVCARCWENARASDGRYEGALREIIHAFKYDGRRSLARPLVDLVRVRHSGAFAEATCVVPVPLFVWRRLRRGFNQAADLASQVDLPVVHALWRIRPTSTQTGLTALQRRRNVRGAFRLSPLLSRDTRARLIVGCAIVLVDDVITTGATTSACAEVLRQAGAREVHVVTVARA